VGEEEGEDGGRIGRRVESVEIVVVRGRRRGN
jgi:hypothetical protein